MKARIYAKKITYIISVSLGAGCYRHLRVSGNDTLHDLADSILWAFGFEHDHLYSFFLDDKWWSAADAYNSPYGEEPPFADRVKLAKLRLEKGQKFKFLFDYGDEWRFQCKVLQVLDEETTDTELVRSKGKAPEQYPDYDGDYDADDDPGSIEMIRPSAPITMSVNPNYQPDAPAVPALEIPDEVLEAAFQFRSDKLWKKIRDNDFFAVRLPNGETGYCSVMGGGGECTALALYIGELGIWSIEQIFQNDHPADFSMLLSQNCLQLGLDNKSDLPEEMTAPVAAYAKSHGIGFRGKNSYPNFLKFQSYYAPRPIREKADFTYILEALRAAHEISERLRDRSKADIGLDERFVTIPLLTPKDSGFAWSEIPFPETAPTYSPYAQPHIDAERLDAVRALPKKGTLESRVYILSDPTPAEKTGEPIFPPLLVSAGSPKKLNGTLRIADDYSSCCSALLEQLTEQMLDAGCCPKKIVTAGERSAAFFSEFCEQCGIEMTVSEPLPKVDKELKSYMQETPPEGANLYALSHILAMLEQMSTEELSAMPDELREMLRELRGTGMMSPSLERKLKGIL